MAVLAGRTFRSATAFCIVSLTIAAACGPKKPPPVVEPPPTVDLDRARALLDSGCYQCLREALALYESVRARHPNELAATDGTAFSLLLLAVRERELGVVDSGYMERARPLAATTSDPSRFALLTEVAESIPWAQSSRVREDGAAGLARFRAIFAKRAEWRGILGPASADHPAISYLAAAFDCAYPERNATPIGALALSDPPVPLLSFAKALCTSTNADQYVALLAREPRFVEAEYYIGLRELGARRLDPADARLTKALTYHAEWPALTTTLGGLALTAEDPERALGLYDRTLAMIPRQQDARIGRLSALSYLGKFEDAIVTADGLVEEGAWYVGDALYWRAWNKMQLNRIEEAWSDITRARSMLVDDKTPKLAGMIAVRRKQYEEAQALFEEARERNPGDCDTAFYLGAVHAQLRHWPQTASTFAEAAPCYTGTATALRNEIARMEASDAAPARKARVIAKRTEQMNAATKEAGTSCYNAAIGYLNSGKKAEARQFAEQAATFEEYKDRMGELLARIEKLK